MVVELFPRLRAYLAETVIPALDGVAPERERALASLAAFIHEGVERELPTKLVYICTHNSRRSHMGQIWAAVAAHYYGLTSVLTYSGGTEVTAFNPRAVDALRRAGFSIDDPGGDNLHYLVRYAAAEGTLHCYSKLYDDASNPSSDFAAIMTCASADEACPVVNGATLRVVTPYEDPKRADGTQGESSAYDERSAQIARETFRAFQLAATL